MFKKLSLLLLSLIAMPTALCAVNNASSSVAFADKTPETLHGYTYHDETRGEANELYRVFDSSDLNPNMKRSFYAPSGYIFTLDIAEEQIEEYVDQMIFAESSLTFIEVAILYNVSGSDVQVLRSKLPTFAPDDPMETKRSYIIQLLETELNGYEILKVENAVSSFDVYPIINIRTSIPNADYTLNLVFNGNKVKSSKFDIGDFVKVIYGYNKINSDDPGHVNISADTTDGFFNEYPYYNEHGWTTDTDVNIYDGEKHANFTYSIYAHNDIPLVLDKIRLSEPLLLSMPDNELPIKAVIKFTSGGQEYTFESNTAILRDPNASILIDGYVDRTAIERNNKHTFELYLNGVDYLSAKTMELESNVIPTRLNDKVHGHELYTNPVLPEAGVEGDYYYVPSNNEIELYNSGKTDELNELPAEGQYYIWNKDSSAFEEYKGVSLFNALYDSSENKDTDPLDLISATLSMPFTGKWSIEVKKAVIDCFTDHYNFRNYYQSLDVFSSETKEDSIALNVPDKTNLILGAGEIVIDPEVITASGLKSEYYFTHEVNRTGVINIVEGENGRLTIQPEHTGLVNLSISVESSLFSKITKQISIRVLDDIYDVSKIEIADEFHKAGENFDVAVNIRGFTNFQNLDVVWKVLNKKKADVTASKVDKHNDATMTMLYPETDDYTISVSYDGIELDKTVVQVRYIDSNRFLRSNIWWIVATTIGFVAIVIFFSTITRRGRSTVDRIARVYEVYCKCIANDSLSKDELVRIKREITRCLHHCEDLNIEAFNQYEKSTRYLRKSLLDVKVLMAKFDELTPEDKGVIYQRLNTDLGKALNVAKEIETAKELIEQRHAEANKKNFETDPNAVKEKKKAK